MLNYNYWNSCSMANSFLGRSGFNYGTAFSWFAFTPKTTYWDVTPVRKPISATVTLAVAAIATFTIPNAVTVVSSNPAFATATITSGIVTITGVAAGTTTVSVLDGGGNLVASIIVTVA
jgi:hypothetical protein